MTHVNLNASQEEAEAAEEEDKLWPDLAPYVYVCVCVCVWRSRASVAVSVIICKPVEVTRRVYAI